MKRALLALSLIALIPVVGCTDENKARTVLLNNGYKDIEITGYKAFTCGKDDDFATGFKATTPGGNKVTGAVCSGILKGATIRFD